MSDQYPEHEKLTEIADQSQAIGEFLEWIQHEKSLVLCVHRDTERDEGGDLVALSGYQPAIYRIDDLLAEFFDIDRTKLEREKLAMLEVCQQQSIPKYMPRQWAMLYPERRIVSESEVIGWARDEAETRGLEVPCAFEKARLLLEDLGLLTLAMDPVITGCGEENQHNQD